MAKQVYFYPGFTPMHRAVARVLEAADDVEVVYGLDPDDRWRRPAGAADAARMTKYATGVLDRSLPDLHAIYAGGPRRVDRATIQRANRWRSCSCPAPDLTRWTWRRRLSMGSRASIRLGSTRPGV